MTDRKAPGEDALPDHLARWLEAASKRLYADIRVQGPFVFPELRGSHRRILQMILLRASGSQTLPGPRA
jgi:hypothetical protein